MINLKELKQLAESAERVGQWPRTSSTVSLSPTQVINLIESLELATRALKEIYAGNGLIPIDGIAKREQRIAFEAIEKLEGIT